MEVEKGRKLKPLGDCRYHKLNNTSKEIRALIENCTDKHTALLDNIS